MRAEFDERKEDPLPTPSMPAARRKHQWVKLRLHTYICRVCGCGRVNVQQPRGGWFIMWHRPTGESHRGIYTPPCEIGALTDKRLKHYESAIASYDTTPADA